MVDCRNRGVDNMDSIDRRLLNAKKILEIIMTYFLYVGMAILYFSVNNIFGWIYVGVLIFYIIAGLKTDG